jgi:hypothetical protein
MLLKLLELLKLCMFRTPKALLLKLLKSLKLHVRNLSMLLEIVRYSSYSNHWDYNVSKPAKALGDWELLELLKSLKLWHVSGPPGSVAQVTQIIEIKACSGLVKASEDSELLKLLKLLKALHVWTPQGAGR